ncbi:hypothetical protein DEA8626_01628 [Defluviimonas aquaemixtae]|uniref:Arylsulfotransferase ASST n=1 Tax=Albidovulum aquaemixtae TaxID=1542388 RepID=A0A2R8B638_9RHOB|nr:arylsulfotransferase family protein [Defluviimonas aquaemixtae]SPH18098.1 hypothetical protein DEA8626_01628 [Defluviimonas aquaemixtae]
MQKLLFAKIEAWLVIFLFLVGILAMVVFGALVLEGQKDAGRFVAPGKVAIAMAEIPRTVQSIITTGPPSRAGRYERFGDRSGWTFPAGEEAGKLDSYLLLSRYDGDRNRHVVELVDLSDHTVRHTWWPDADEMLADVPQDSDVINYSRWSTLEYEVVHPLLTPVGDLLIKDHQTPVTRIDHCARPVWQNAESYYHHSTELGPEGAMWLPSRIVPAPEKHGRHFFVDGLAEVTLDGELLREISLPGLLERNGMMATMFTAGSYVDDPLHLNDIQPVMADGPYWKRGDLFLSMRHRSLVLLYRPSEDRVIWHKQGPWLAQHDVDILDDRRIAIFNNNTYNRGQGSFILGANEINVYDFATDEVSSPFKEALAEMESLTLTEGLFDLTADGSAIVEEENSGRILIFAPDGRPVAEFVNRAEDDGAVYGLGWSRLITRAEGDAALQAIAARPACG